MYAVVFQNLSVAVIAVAYARVASLGHQTGAIGGKLLQVLFFGILSPFLISRLAVWVQRVP